MRWLRGLGYSVGALAALVLVLVLTRAVWLPWIAQRLVIEDEPARAELLFVFAGAPEERGIHAARLYQQGVAPRILVTGQGVSRDIAYFCGRQVTKAELTAKAIETAGVPPSVIHVLPQGTSTYEESEALKTYMLDHGFNTVVVVSSPYHMRRVRATLRHVLRGTTIRVGYSPAQPSRFRVAGWWTRERDTLLVFSEYLKLLYYYVARF